MDAGSIILRAQRMAGRVDPNFDERCLEFLTEAVERWSQAHPWPTMRYVTDVQTTGTRDLVAPDYFQDVIWIADKTHSLPLESSDFWDRTRPGTYLSDSSAQACEWREMSIEPVYRQPTTASVITVRSETSDSYGVSVVGIAQDTTASGTAGEFYVHDELLSVAGSGPASSTAAYTRVLSLGRNKRSAYPLLVSDASGQIGRIGRGQFNAAYRRLELQPVPAAGTTVRMGGLLRPTPVTRATDVPHPSVGREYLVAYVAAQIHKAQGQFEQYQLSKAAADEILGERLVKERTAGDKGHTGLPDLSYWDHEDLRSWP